jgi:tripartite-type tricarboxylate transporter receptor subunit TctC
MSRIRFIAMAAAAILLSPCVASSQNWPNRPVNMLVTQPAGGIADILAREIAQALAEQTGQPFVVENRPGASGNLAAAAAAKAAPDGGTLLFATQAQVAFNKFMFKSLPYDPARDFVPIVLVSKSPVALVAGLNAPVSSFQTMLDYAKANPGRLTVGHAGVGSMAHLAFELVQAKAGIQLTGVPYKGGAPMVTDLLGGHLPLASDLVANFIRLAEDKKARLLAVGTTQRISKLPDVPTMQEMLHTPLEAAAWFTIMAPTGTPAAILEKINAVTNRYLQSAKAKDLMEKQVVEAGGGTPAEAAAFVKAEMTKWQPVIQAAHIAMD